MRLGTRQTLRAQRAWHSGAFGCLVPSLNFELGPLGSGWVVQERGRDGQHFDVFSSFHACCSSTYLIPGSRNCESPSAFWWKRQDQLSKAQEQRRSFQRGEAPWPKHTGCSGLHGSGLL